MSRPAGGVRFDIWLRSFWYAATGYLAELPNARFVVADYAATEEPADVVGAWFPF